MMDSQPSTLSKSEASIGLRAFFMGAVAGERAGSLSIKTAPTKFIDAVSMLIGYGNFFCNASYDIATLTEVQL